MGSQVTQFLQAAQTGRGAAPWPRAAVFDCDGLLVDTADCWTGAYRVAAEAAGGALDGLDLASLDGAAVPVAATHLSEALGRPVSGSGVHNALQRAIASQPIRAMPGAERLLSALSGGLQLAVASNAPADVVYTALTRSGLDRFLNTIVSAETNGVFKPLPDVYLQACRQLGVDPSDALAFEDSAVGAQAACAAGLTVVVVPVAARTRPYADLAVPRLDDPRVFDLLGVHPPARTRLTATKH